MEQQTCHPDMLDLLIQPSFYVQSGVITRVNQSAARHQLEPGTELSGILETGAEEYSRFQGGELYLFLRIHETVTGATVTRVGVNDVFLLDMNSEQDVFHALSLAAQELREPLSAIMAVSGKLLPDPPEDTEHRVARQLAQYNRSLYKMLRLIGNMSYVEYANRQPTHKNEFCNIRSYFNELNATTDLLLTKGNRTLVYKELSDDLYCFFNHELLERAYLNLLSNAIKFSPNGSKIRTTLTRNGRYLYLTVENQRDHEPTSNFFASFHREPGIHDGRIGVGLGMVLVRSAARIHNGAVLVQQTSKTTKVTLSLQIKTASDEVRTDRLLFDYAGYWDHCLLELSDVLPADAYQNF